MRKSHVNIAPAKMGNLVGRKPLSSLVAPRTFALEFRIRGELHRAYRTNCKDLEEALHLSEMQFPKFESRNPWMVQDSQQRRILILLDP